MSYYYPYEDVERVAKALAESSSDGTISSSGWGGLDRFTKHRLMIVAKLALKMERDSR